MPKAVRFNQYGGIDVLQVVEVERPTPRQGEVLVRVKAAGINPSEAGIREGFLHSIWPAPFPCAEGTDLPATVTHPSPYLPPPPPRHPAIASPHLLPHP